MSNLNETKTNLQLKKQTIHTMKLDGLINLQLFEIFNTKLYNFFWHNRYIAYGGRERPKIDCSGQNVFHLTWKEHLRQFMRDLKCSKYSTTAKCDKITTFDSH